MTVWRLDRAAGALLAPYQDKVNAYFWVIFDVARPERGLQAAQYRQPPRAHPYDNRRSSGNDAEPTIPTAASMVAESHWTFRGSQTQAIATDWTGLGGRRGRIDPAQRTGRHAVHGPTQSPKR